METSGQESESVRVLLLDGHALRRAALKSLLRHEGAMDVVVDAEDDPAIAALAHLITFDVVLVCGSTIERLDATLTALSHSVPAARVVWLTDRVEAGIEARVVEDGLVDRGLVGMVGEHEGPDALLHTLRQVHAGVASLGSDATSRALVRILQKNADDQRPPEGVRLTRREREVIALLGKAQTNKQIAEALFISHATVRNHLTSIFRKLELSNRLELLVYAFEHDLIDDSATARSAVHGGPEPEIAHAAAPEWDDTRDPVS